MSLARCTTSRFAPWLAGLNEFDPSNGSVLSKRALAVFLAAVFCCLWVGSAIGEDGADWRRELGAAEPVSGSLLTAPSVAGKVAVVTFFASWCPPCFEEFDHLNSVAAGTRKSEVAIVGVNVFEAWGGGENAARMKRFLDKTKPQFALVRGTPQMRQTFGGIERIPSLIVFDRSGLEVWRFVHERGSKKTHASMTEIMHALKLAGYND